MPSIDEVAEQIIAAAVPVLFLGTCILLDIIQSTERCRQNFAATARELVGLASTTPPKCIVVVSSIVPAEWNDNAQRVTDELKGHLAKLEEHASYFHDACEAIGIAAGFERAVYTRAGLAESLRDLSRQVLNSAICLDEDDQCKLRAHGRATSNLPPSRKKGGVQDCTIIEECFAVSRRLQVSGFARSRVFCTSNTKDYCDVGKGLHSTLAIEFAACDLTFTTNLPWAVHEITH
jgi:hypothetical protein